VGYLGRRAARRLAATPLSASPPTPPSAPVAELRATFSLASARRLPSVAEGHPCGRLHGHTFGVQLLLRGPIDPVMGWVMDFEEITAAWAPMCDRLDHRVLNDVAGLENPTSERLAVWILEALAPALPLLTAVTVSETGGFEATYRIG
jgi:6-pyruvoyltetrahydropterin/6-carboxytetrahydropterin synthase